MEIIPAIDIMDKKAVRLEQGKFEKEKVYSENPVLVGQKWKQMGARTIHVVDLDGARLGRPVNLDVVREIANRVKIDIELGGGLRTENDIESAFKEGARFAVIGTSAVKDGLFAESLVRKYGEKVIFAVDAKDGKAAVKGWREAAEMDVMEYIKKLEASGAKRIIYTDISRDGMMTGPDVEKLKMVLKFTKMEVVFSGGISSIEDIKALKELESEGLKGVIIGKALYEGKLDLREAINVG